MSGGSHISDYLKSIPMDIGLKYFPLPAVSMHKVSEVVFPLEALDEEYDFRAETKAVKDFKHSEDLRIEREKQEEEQAKLEEERQIAENSVSLEDSPLSSTNTTGSNDEDSSINNALNSTSEPAVSDSVNNVTAAAHENAPSLFPLKNPTHSSSPLVPIQPAQEILQPQPLQVRAHHRRKSSGSQKWNLLADFEPAANASPFDALAIKTMNDRELLQEILDPLGRENRQQQNGIFVQHGAETVKKTVPQPHNGHVPEDSSNRAGVIRNGSQSDQYFIQSWPNANFAITSTSEQTQTFKSNHMEDPWRNSWAGKSSNLPVLASLSQDSVANPSLKPATNGYNFAFDLNRAITQGAAPFKSNFQSSQMSAISDVERKHIMPSTLEAGRTFRADSTGNSCAESMNPIMKASSSSPDLSELTQQANKLALRDVPNENCKAEPAMTDSERLVVESISQLGFPQNQILRCLRKSNITDRGKLVELLLLIRSHSQNGWDLEIVEEAVMYSNSDNEKVRQFIRAAFQLQGLGFEGPKLFTALKHCQCSRDKALDFLLNNG